MKKIIVSTLIPFLLASCAGTKQYQSYKDFDAENTALLHVVRAKGVWGSAVPAPVYVNKQLIGRIGPGGHLSTKIPEGTVAVSSTTTDVIVNSKRGEVYYIQIKMPKQLWLMTPDFNVVNIDKEKASDIVPGI